MSQKSIAARVAALVAALCLWAAGAWAGPIGDYQTPRPAIRNIIIMIPDGMSQGGLTLARWYRAYNPDTGGVDVSLRLALDDMVSGSVRTYWQTPAVTGAITDSAPAGTALATGHKTNDKHVGVSGDAAQSPYANILEAARALGKATGLVATANIQHATPAAFSSHYFDRARYDILGEQQVHQGMDVVLGGGAGYLTPPYREDGADLVETLRDAGYAYATTRAEMDAVRAGRLWGMFASDAMAYDMDRALTAASEPSLSEMTAKALALLSANPNGFFLMVEGSKVDWAAHANDPMGVISDVLAFDDAVAVALEYARAHQDTMVLALTDHGNGGITIGNADTTDTYPQEPLARFLAPLHRARLTGEGIEKMLDGDRGNIREVMAEYLGIDDLTDAEVDAIRQAEAGDVNYAVGPVLSARAGIGWTTGGHTGEDVALFTYLPGDDRIWGLIDNTDVARTAAAIWGVDLDALTRALYVNANEAFAAMGAQVSVCGLETPDPVLVVQWDGAALEIPESRNYVLHNGEPVPLDSVTVQTNGVFYVPQAVIDLFPPGGSASAP